MSRVQEVMEQHDAHHDTIKPGLCLECDLVHEIVRLRDELARARRYAVADQRFAQWYWTMNVGKP